MTLINLKKEIKKNQNKERAKISQSFFKTKKGEYGEGDVFLGLTVPQSRTIAQKYTSLSLQELQTLLYSKIHEERLIALLILVEKYKKKENQEEIYEYYLTHIAQVNNWDLVDLTAPKIVGNHLLKKDRKILYTLAQSKDLWKKRVAIVATWTFIRNNDFKDTVAISERLLNEKHDLLHKAVGWMLREIGKKDQKIEEEFLKKHYKTMPRTMLRYAIEKFPESKRKQYLKGEI